MKQRLTLVLALVLAVAAVVLIQIYVSSTGRQQATEGTEMVDVMVAAREIQGGEIIDPGMVEQDKIPRQYMHQDAVTGREAESLNNQEVVRRIPTGQIILWSDLATSQSYFQLSKAIQESSRAVTISVDNVTGVGGHLRPDDYVDVLATFSVPNEVTLDAGDEESDEADSLVWSAASRISEQFQVKRVTMTLLQRVQVLAVGNVTGGSANLNIPEMGGGSAINPGMINANRAGAVQAALGTQGYRNVTLMVTPLEAEILAFSVDQGTLSLSLRHPDDLEQVELPKLTLADILDLKFEERRRPTPQVRQRPNVPTILDNDD